MDKDLHLSQHISHRFNVELEEIRNSVMKMGGLVEKQISSGLQALLDADSELGQVVAMSDIEINALEVDIDDLPGLERVVAVGPRLDHVDERLAVLQRIDHRRGELGRVRDISDGGGEVLGTAVAMHVERAAEAPDQSIAGTDRA